MKCINHDVLICAHTHIPAIKKFNNRVYINCGSVGKPKIGRPNTTYCILNINETGEVKVQIKEITYPYKKIVKDMIMLNFPKKLIESLENGSE